MKDILIEKDKNGVATITLNRPERHNAFDDMLISRLQQILNDLNGDSNVRVIVLAAKGKSFSAGADLNWMRKMAGYSTEENYTDALAMAECFNTLATCRKPTIALVQGAAIGGGVGLVAACDIALAANTASFCLSEVKLGLIPAVISPYVNRAIGKRAAQKYYLTAERFSCDEAMRIGLVHAVVQPAELLNSARHYCDLLLKNGPEAMAAVKTRLATYDDPTFDQVGPYTAQLISEIRTTHEGSEGIRAFLEKRSPSWIQRDD